MCVNTMYVDFEPVFDPTREQLMVVVLPNVDGCAVHGSNATQVTTGEPWFKIKDLAG